MAKKKAKNKQRGLGQKISELSDKLRSAEAEISNHKNFMSNVLAILGKKTEIIHGIFDRSFRIERLSDEQDILQRIVELKESLAREDEGTKCQAEHIGNLDDALHTLMNDPKRTLEVNRDFELIKLGYNKIFEGGRFRWVKNRNDVN